MIKSASPAESTSAANRSSNAARLLRVAAFASALVPLSAIAAEATHIPVDVHCKTETAGCIAAFNSGANSHTWGFYELGPGEPGFDPLEYFYTLTIAGALASDAAFVLEVEDVVVPQSALPGGTCVPIRANNRCSYFDVRLFGNQPLGFLDGFSLTITWYQNGNPLSGALLTTANTAILRAADYLNFTDSVAGTIFTPGVEPEIEGQELEIGRFAVQTTLVPLPEPPLLLLVGAGAAGWLCRRMMRG
jgi:hypothetical protein